MKWLHILLWTKLVVTGASRYRCQTCHQCHWFAIPRKDNIRHDLIVFNTAYARLFLQMITIACVMLFSAGGQLFTDIRATALTFGTYGAYIIIPLFLIAGYIIGEVTPVLLVSGNILRIQFFSTEGSSNSKELSIHYQVLAFNTCRF